MLENTNQPQQVNNINLADVSSANVILCLPTKLGHNEMAKLMGNDMAKPRDNEMAKLKEYMASNYQRENLATHKSPNVVFQQSISSSSWLIVS